MTAPEIEPTGRRTARLGQTVGDMVRSLLVVLAVVAVVMILAWRPDPEPVKVVDIAPAVSLAGMTADFPVLVPTGLPDGWRATSARWEPTQESGPDPVLHIGYVTPADSYAQVSQSAAASTGYLDEQTDRGREVGTAEIAASRWVRAESADRRSLVRQDRGVTTVVSGNASWDELTQLVASLEPAPEA